jgi:hypothetical protein
MGVYGSIARLRRVFGGLLVVAGLLSTLLLHFGHAKSRDCCVPPSALRLAYDSPAYRSCSLRNLYTLPQQFSTRCLLFRLTRPSSSRLWASRTLPSGPRPTAKYPDHFLCSYTTQEFDELCFEFGTFLLLLVHIVTLTDFDSQVSNSMKTYA